MDSPAAAACSSEPFGFLALFGFVALVAPLLVILVEGRAAANGSSGSTASSSISSCSTAASFLVRTDCSDLECFIGCSSSRGTVASRGRGLATGVDVGRDIGATGVPFPNSFFRIVSLDQWRPTELSPLDDSDSVNSGSSSRSIAVSEPLAAANSSAGIAANG